MLTGLPPFYCRDREKLFEKIKKGTLEYPKYLSPRATILLKGLLTKEPRRRLGSGPNDAEDIKEQEFFRDLDWEKLMKGEIAPPWNPQINGSMDTSQFDHEFTNLPLNSPGAFQVSFRFISARMSSYHSYLTCDSFYEGPWIRDYTC
jgi:serine/threonine protein kinase